MNVINYRNSGSFSGYRNVFNKDAGAWFQSVRLGAKLSTTHCPEYGGFIHAGEFGYLNETTGVVSWLKVFELAESITALSTTVKIYQREYDPTLKATDVLIAAPATQTTTGKAVTVGTLTAGTLDGDAIPNGKEYFSKIKYVKLSTSTDTGLIIDNKKMAVKNKKTKFNCPCFIGFSAFITTKYEPINSKTKCIGPN